MNASPLTGQSALAWLNDHTGRNRGAWLSIAAALDKNPLRDLADHARRIGQAEAVRQPRTDQQPEADA